MSSNIRDNPSVVPEDHSAAILGYEEGAVGGILASKEAHSGGLANGTWRHCGLERDNLRRFWRSSSPPWRTIGPSTALRNSLDGGNKGCSGPVVFAGSPPGAGGFSGAKYVPPPRRGGQGSEHQQQGPLPLRGVRYHRLSSHVSYNDIVSAGGHGVLG